MLVTIRHGQTDYNIKRVFSGKEDTPRLTNEAHLKAYEVGKILKDYNLELAIISPLTRALETFLEINKSINIPSYHQHRNSRFPSQCRTDCCRLPTDLHLDTVHHCLH